MTGVGLQAKGLELPNRVILKTPQQTFTHKYDFMLIDGKIWVKSRISGGEFSNWDMLNGHGLPAKSKTASPYKKVSKLKEISADGENLIAVDTNNIVYYTKTYNWKWKDHFSVLPMTKQLKLPVGKRAFGISHRGNYMKYYNDIDGNAHSVSAGVTTLYLLDKSGHTIFFADPWLPPKFSHIIDTPNQGTFIASNMAVSGSTIFLINAAGEMYTRLYDYDTSGQNPVLAYSYKREKRKSSSRKMVRSLPNESWRKQPNIDAKITNSITIFQTGKGNSSFELRVEGQDPDGNTGYYTKAIYDDDWNFVPTNLPLTGKAINTNVAKSKLFCPAKVRSYSGVIKRGKFEVKATLEDFWPYSPPSMISFKIGKETFKAKLHTRKYHKKSGKRIACAATIELPESLGKSRNAKVKQIYTKLFKNNSLIDMVLVSDKNKVSAVEDLHIIGLAEIADNIISLMNKNGISGELKAKFHKRLRLIFQSPK